LKQLVRGKINRPKTKNIHQSCGCDSLWHQQQYQQCESSDINTESQTYLLYIQYSGVNKRVPAAIY